MEVIRDLNRLHPVVARLATQLLEACKKEGLVIGISETYRTVERQDYLYAQGRTRPGAIVTYARGSSKSSYHQWGLAFDVFQNIRGQEYDTKVLRRVGEIGESLGLEWGGRFQGFVDMTHFQYTFGLSIADLNSGKLPPQDDGDIYLKAVEVLEKAGIIGMPELWKTRSYKQNHVDSLIIKVAAKLSSQ
jgi:peptidoglycan L-alanyl-D-glutamate endopeptidase CwlK